MAFSIYADEIKKKALKLGFDAAGIARPEIMQESGALLDRWLREDRHGTMDWMKKRANERANPAAFFDEVNSILMAAHNYYRSSEKMIPSLQSGTVSIYARGRDYHKVIRKKLIKLLEWLRKQEPNARGRVFVDSFPIMEKPLAARAGLGWLAKNTTLIIKGKGSYFFLGGILLNLPLPPDQPFSGEYCGNCNRCQAACPTDALADWQIDARRCISYLTIEHDGEIDSHYQSQMGNYIFGCDICQIVCPWNRFSQDTAETDYFTRFDENDLNLEKLAGLSQKEYRKMFEGAPVRRAGYERFRRNVQIALRNAEMVRNANR